MNDATAPVPLSYRIGPRDLLTITVFREPELSVEEMPVDVSGKLSYPLIGEIQAVGLTAQELSRSIADRLNARYLRDARVSVAIADAVNYAVTVEGEVKKPGIYPIRGRATLTQAVAMGEGLSVDGQPDDIVILRTINGKRYAARFDLQQIRLGALADPELQQADVVIVGFSRSSRFQRQLVTLLPGLAATLGVFLAFR
ncbi:polysaccharide biosynthesis/export family protein [Sphingomonas cynarae]